MTIELLKIGARGSPLSLAQTSLVARMLEEANPGLKTEIVPIKTTGDKMREVSLAQIGGKGVFVKEIEEALLSGKVDLAVHSAKDVPAQLPDGLTLAAVPQRADFRDTLVTRRPGGLEALAEGAVVGTSGLRRQAQLLALRPDLKIAPIRGNIESRLNKVATEVEATLLAAAGLDRLGLNPANGQPLSPEIMLPSPGQGTLALEARLTDLEILETVQAVNHQPTYVCLAAERGFLSRLGAGCQLPVAALARIEGAVMTLEGLIASLDGRRTVREVRTGELDSAEGAANFGKMMATRLLEKGGTEIMKEAGLI